MQADSGQLYSSAMQGLSSYANNIMGHTMNQYAAQSSLLSTQVWLLLLNKLFYNAHSIFSPDLSGEQQHLKGRRRKLWKFRRNPTTTTGADPRNGWPDCRWPLNFKVNVEVGFWQVGLGLIWFGLVLVRMGGKTAGEHQTSKSTLELDSDKLVLASLGWLSSIFFESVGEIVWFWRVCPCRWAGCLLLSSTYFGSL